MIIRNQDAAAWLVAVFASAFVDDSAFDSVSWAVYEMYARYALVHALENVF